MSFDCTEVEKESREEGNIHDDILQYLGQHMVSRISHIDEFRLTNTQIEYYRFPASSQRVLELYMIQIEIG